MSDYLVNAASKPAIRKVMQSVGIPTPTELERARGTYQEKFLEGQKVLVGGGVNASAGQAVDASLTATGDRKSVV